MSESLSDKFEVHRSLIAELLEDNSFVGDCGVEILAALDNMKADIDNHDCEDFVDTPDVSLEDILDFIDKSSDLEDEIILDALSSNDAYLIKARNLNEVDRIEKFIEELNTNPYAP